MVTAIAVAVAVPQEQSILFSGVNIYCSIVKISVFAIFPVFRGKKGKCCAPLINSKKKSPYLIFNRPDYVCCVHRENLRKILKDLGMIPQKTRVKTACS